MRTWGSRDGAGTGTGLGTRQRRFGLDDDGDPRRLITAGIDIGAKTVKAVLLESPNKVLARGLVPAGSDTGAAIQEAYDRALKAAGITANQVLELMATGTGRKECSLTENEIISNINRTVLLNRFMGFLLNLNF